MNGRRMHNGTMERTNPQKFNKGDEEWWGSGWYTANCRKSIIKSMPHSSAFPLYKQYINIWLLKQLPPFYSEGATEYGVKWETVNFPQKYRKETDYLTFIVVHTTEITLFIRRVTILLRITKFDTIIIRIIVRGETETLKMLYCICV